MTDLLLAPGFSTQTPGMLFVPPGTYVVARSAELAKPAVLQPGATFSISDGATLTIKHALNAGPWQVFAGQGSVRFRPGTGFSIMPEWFGEWGVAPRRVGGQAGGEGAGGHVGWCWVAAQLLNYQL